MAKPTNRKKTRLTQVPDRCEGVPLGHEARWLADILRGCGADASKVPREVIDPQQQRGVWLEKRALAASNVPLWVLDYALAILEQIPGRTDRPRGRPRDAMTEALEVWRQGGGSVAEDARVLETLRARREDHQADNENLTDDERQAKPDLIDVTIKHRAPNLARRDYKRRSKRRKE